MMEAFGELRSDLARGVSAQQIARTLARVSEGLYYHELEQLVTYLITSFRGREVTVDVVDLRPESTHAYEFCVKSLPYERVTPKAARCAGQHLLCKTATHIKHVYVMEHPHADLIFYTHLKVREATLYLPFRSDTHSLNGMGAIDRLKVKGDPHRMEDLLYLERFLTEHTPARVSFEVQYGQMPRNVKARLHDVCEHIGSVIVRE